MRSLALGHWRADASTLSRRLGLESVLRCPGEFGAGAIDSVGFVSIPMVPDHGPHPAHALHRFAYFCSSEDVGWIVAYGSIARA